MSQLPLNPIKHLNFLLPKKNEVKIPQIAIKRFLITRENSARNCNKTPKAI